jgi:hypothetical protein
MLAGKRSQRAADDRFAMGQLVLKRATASRPSGEWNDDDYDVLCDGIVVGIKTIEVARVRIIDAGRH